MRKRGKAFARAEGKAKEQDPAGAWDAQYRKQGRVWRGRAPKLPDLPEGTQVLELGCGNGKTLQAMLTKRWDICAVDFSVEALDLCQAMLARSTPGSVVTLMLADAKKLPLPDESFEAVIAYHILGHDLSKGRKAMAKEAARVLSPGGRLYAKVFSANDMRSGRGRELEPGTFRKGDGIITHYFSQKEAVGLMKGLTLVSVSEVKWHQRAGGKKLERAELELCFEKPK